MNKTLLVIRILFVLLCAFGGWLLAQAIPDFERREVYSTVVATLIGVLIVLTDVLLKGFSVRGLTSLSFGLALGAGISFLISKSPLFDYGDDQVIFITRLTLFVGCSYLGAVIALRSRDDFNFVIPFVKFVPHNVESPLIVVDSSALIDGRIAKVCETHFLTSGIVVPRFVLRELQAMADSPDPLRKARGRKGLDVLNSIRAAAQADLRIDETDTEIPGDSGARLVFLCQSLKARLLTCDTNLAKYAEIHGVRCLNLSALARAMVKEWCVGETVVVDLVKPGKEEGQAVGYLEDGSMVVASDARGQLGKRVAAEIQSLVPSGAGKIAFVKVLEVVADLHARGNGRF